MVVAMKLNRALINFIVHSNKNLPGFLISSLFKSECTYKCDPCHILKYLQTYCGITTDPNQGPT